MTTDLAQGERCAVPMDLARQACGRPFHCSPSHDVAPVCLMHSRDPQKSNAEFQREFEDILKTAEEAGDIANFTSFVFPESDYMDRTFLVPVCFAGVKFTRAARFRHATFMRDAEFRHAMFAQHAEFDNSKFIQNADFYDAEFTGQARFRGAKFTELSSFTGAKFTQIAKFHHAVFTRGASFVGAVFMQDARFHRSMFKQHREFLDTTFVETTFAETADFYETAFMSTAYFMGAKFLGAARFRETKFRKDKELCPGPVFALAEFARPEAAVFYRTYLGQALFHNCDVSKINFSSVEWRMRKNCDKRMVFEEVVTLSLPNEDGVELSPKGQSPGQRDYGLIAELYQQLKKNYDERKDYWTAGDFHYGEMEMKRLHSRRQHLGLVAWYKYTSQYGESYVRPFTVLLIVLASFTLLFPWAGLDRNETPSHPIAITTMPTLRPDATSELSYKHFTDFVGAYPGRKWTGRASFFGNSMMTTLSVAGFQKELRYEPSYPWGRALAFLEVLLTSTLVALFLLAIRRQFRR